MLTPSMGFCVTPLTTAGCGMPAASRIVGTMSMQWWNWVRRPPWSWMRFGQWTTIGLRVPPKCEAICLVHWKGVFMAQAQPTGMWLLALGPPTSSRCWIR